MMCPFCGKHSQDNRAFCMYCGVEIPRHVSGCGNSAILGDDERSSPESTCYETLDITGCEWRDGDTTDSVRPERDGVGYTPLGINDVSAFSGTEWRAECRQSSEEIEPAPFVSDIIPESEFSSAPVKDDVNSVIEAPSRSEEAPQDHQDTPPQNEEEQLQSALNGAYTILRKLGKGGMASVYLARENALDREVAIKVLPQVYQGDEQFSARFHREACLSAMLEHPHIVRIYRIGDEPGLNYFVMNYIPGGPLSDRMRNGRIVPVRDIVRWGADICSALAYAHERGVIHRDLKPDNIMIDRRNRAVVTDFGIAHALQGTSLTQTGAVIGTPQYMSPDQACGKTPDIRSDIYSLGMVLYQMAAGTLPFRATDPVALMYMHVHKAPQPPETFNPNIPRWLQDIILRCLAKKPSDRFQNAMELRSALIEGEAGRPIRVSVNPENEHGINSIFGKLVSSAVSGFRGKEPRRHLAAPLDGQERPRHSLKLPRDVH